MNALRAKEKNVVNLSYFMKKNMIQRLYVTEKFLTVELNTLPFKFQKM